MGEGWCRSVKELRVVSLTVCVLLVLLGFAIMHVAAVSQDQIERYSIEYQGEMGL
jgi:hypothetical protein